MTHDQDRRYYALTIRPSVFVNLVPDNEIFHRLVPLAQDRTIVECDWLHLSDVVASGVDLVKSIKLFGLVNQQDLEACELCQAATDARRFPDRGVLLPGEHRIAASRTGPSTPSPTDPRAHRSGRAHRHQNR